MIEYRVGNLLEQPDLTHIAHQANLFHTFGSGIAKEIRLKWPRAYEVDLQTPYGNKNKLGSWSISPGVPTIVNLYAQVGLGSADRQTSYDALDSVLRQLEIFLLEKEEPVKLGVPYKIGCGLANGNWKIVSSIIESIYDKSLIPLVICRLPS